VILPIVLPAAAGALLALLKGHERLERGLSLAASVALVIIAAELVRQAGDGGYQVYALGSWRPPFGIVLVLDRLSALMVLLTAVLALCALIYAVAGQDRNGKLFHALFQFQLMGVNGAFLTGDLFNLFVFFEVLLVASYGLLLHGRSAAALKAGLHYVALNLVGSALFLIGVGLLYAVTGTLNLADLSARLLVLPPEERVLAHSAELMLLVVFGLKAALFPLSMWLPGAYAAASPPVAALFAIMTKVGVYAILRVSSVVFGKHAWPAVSDLDLWVLAGGLATMLVAALGIVSSTRLSRLAAFLTLMSVGTLLAVLPAKSPPALSAGLFYLVHSTLAGGLLFLVIGTVAAQRGQSADLLQRSGRVAHPLLVGILFVAVVVSVIGMPPLSGFLAKALLLQASASSPLRGAVWAAILVSSFLALIALSRAGITVFWGCRSEPAPAAGGLSLPALLGCLGLLGCLLALTVLAEPVKLYADGIAAQLRHPQGYVDAVLWAKGR
jgi:multicomponent K+:H+ antiporter subunit D